MTAFELGYLCAEPFMLPLYQTVRTRLLGLLPPTPHPTLLDVGGRKSHYTIGVPAHITITDLPRETALQRALNLGLDEPSIVQTRARRTNIANLIFDDMTHSQLGDATFDCIVAVEVLEHVEEDALFLQHICRILKPGGTFLMTTPNGDSVRNTNPDHKRHYRHRHLHELLSEYFDEVSVEYAICAGRFRTWGLRPFSVRHPLRTLLGLVSNLVNARQSSAPAVRSSAQGTRHLIACARKGGVAMVSH
jgi:SAM-dependent methyltransferase